MHIYQQLLIPKPCSLQVALLPILQFQLKELGLIASDCFSNFSEILESEEVSYFSH